MGECDGNGSRGWSGATEIFQVFGVAGIVCLSAWRIVRRDVIDMCTWITSTVRSKNDNNNPHPPVSRALWRSIPIIHWRSTDYEGGPRRLVPSSTLTICS